MSGSSQNKVEEELRVLKQRIESILGSITGCFFVLDHNWSFLHMNHPSDGYLPCPREELLGKTLWEAYPHWKGTKCNDLLDRALSEKDTVHFEFFDKKQSRWYEMYAFHMPGGLSIHFHDISSRKGVEERLRLVYEEVERQIQERTRELLQSNQALQAEIVERKRIEREILEITQEEQRRFGSQLHDGLCQELTAILVFAKGLTQKMEKENRLDIAELKKISDLLHGAVDQARDTARGLYPGELEGSSLMHTLEELTLSTQKLSGVSCRFFCPKPILINDNNIATHLFKVAQEGVSNAVSYGKPQSIKVALTEQYGMITLIVKDDGVGFIPDPEKRKGIGLKIMRYRAHLMGASFQVEPNSPHGVILKCSLKSP
jgi:signal transduction histidine kinase